MREALRAAPGEVRLDGTPLSAASAPRATAASCATWGRPTSTRRPRSAAAAARDRTAREATQLGYLMGAVRRSGSAEQGVNYELVRRLEQELRGWTPRPPRSAAASGPGGAAAERWPRHDATAVRWRQELWGSETSKAVDNFPVSGERVPVAVVRMLGHIKAAAARTNGELGLLDSDLAERIAAAGDEVGARRARRPVPHRRVPDRARAPPPTRTPTR